MRFEENQTKLINTLESKKEVSPTILRREILKIL